MCSVSIVGDYYSDRFKWVPQQIPAPVFQAGISRFEFEALRAEVREMKELLKAAKRIDELTGQPDCEMDEKLVVLRRIAELVGIDLDNVLARGASK